MFRSFPEKASDNWIFKKILNDLNFLLGGDSNIIFRLKVKVNFFKSAI